ncbi:MAG: DUF362 domain-containing protein, partial [Acidobacteriota bacterium]
MKDEKIGRREFLKQIGRTSIAVAGSTGGALWLHDRLSGVEETPTVSLKTYDVPLGQSDVQMAIVHGRSVERMARAAVDELGGMSRFIQKGDVVFIKPNVAFDRGPKLAATTHPDTLRAIIALCREAGAGKIIVADNPINSPEGCFYKSGIKKASEDAGASVMY